MMEDDYQEPLPGEGFGWAHVNQPHVGGDRKWSSRDEMAFLCLKKSLEEEAAQERSWRQTRYGVSRVGEQVTEAFFRLTRDSQMDMP